MMKNYWKNWDFMRILRLVLGIIVAAQGIQASEWLLVILGGLFALMPILNVGCCGTSGCRTTIPKSSRGVEDITYQEVKTK